MGLVKYILKVDLEYSPEKISEAIIVERKGICVISTALIIYEDLPYVNSLYVGEITPPQIVI